MLCYGVRFTGFKALLPVASMGRVGSYSHFTDEEIVKEHVSELSRSGRKLTELEPELIPETLIGYRPYHAWLPDQLLPFWGLTV